MCLKFSGDFAEWEGKVYSPVKLVTDSTVSHSEIVFWKFKIDQGGALLH